MPKLFIVPKVDHVKENVVRPFTNKQRAKLRKLEGDATPEQLDSLAAKFNQPKPRRRRHLHVVETINFFGDWDSTDGDDAA